MQILENDGSFITVQNLDPKWSPAEIASRHHQRIADALVEAKLLKRGELVWIDDEILAELGGGSYQRLRADQAFKMVKLPDTVRDEISREMAGDYREAVGKSRSDAKTVKSTRRRRSYEEWADEFGIPTNDTMPGWKAVVVAAVQEAPTRGQVDA